MRLTLRNLLAYLNNIIEDPADIEEMRRKIEESEFATGLVHRIRSATSRQRLGAPSLEGRGIGLDVNSVAEYLDNELPPDRIPDLEKICVESDVHLAEVAACYQILAIYMKGTAEVDRGLRDRVCAVSASGEARPREHGSAAIRGDQQGGGSSLGTAHVEPVPPPATMVPPAPPPQPIVARARKPFEVPEYLRVGQTGKWKPLAMTLLLAFLLSAVALRAMGPFDRNHPLVRLLGVSPSVEVTQGPSPRVAAPAQELPDGGVAEPPAAAGEPGVATTPGQPAAELIEPQAAGDSTKVQPPLAERIPAGKPDRKTAPPPGVQAPPAAETRQPGGKVEPGEPRPPSEQEEEMLPAAESPPSVAAEGPKPPAADGGLAEAPPVPAPAAPIEVGYVKLSQPDFLVRYVAESAEWLRLPARTKLMSGDRLVVFPTYRPEIVLTPGVQVVLAGPSAVQTKPPNAQGEPELTIEYGRALIATAGVAGARIHLDLGGQKGIVTFQEAAAEMGIEVSRYLPPGADPETEPALPVVSIYTTIGRIEWQTAGAPTATPVEQGQVRVLVGDQSQTMAVVQSPAWIQGADLRDVDRLASSTLEPFIALDRPVSLTLRERTEDRKSEIRSLAARCLAYLDSFETLVKEFGDDRQRSYWTAEYDALRQSLSRSPETAAKVRKALEAFSGADAADLYRLSWGYSVEQLREGGDKKLVEFLDHDSLQIRVFAFENLQRITKKTLLYLPEVAATRRRSSVQRWKEQLENGAIVYETLPSPLPN
ncbi:MAG: hypothetical protein MUF25_01660 [Pirellulaceae bacterium]|nr:hypothetical protein [Pirellulaceae bacterium]